APVVLVVLAALALASGVAGLLLARRRRRGAGAAAGSPGDPWGPEGIFASFGAIDPRATRERQDPSRATPSAPTCVDHRDPAQTVPALIMATEREVPAYLGTVGRSLRSRATN